MYNHIILMAFILIFSIGCGGNNSAEDNSTNDISSKNTQALLDNDACVTDNTWGKITDSWHTTEGQFSEDGILWLRSQIAVEPTEVVAFYYRTDTFGDNDYVNLGRYTINNPSDNTILAFDVMVNSSYLGSSPYLYFQIQNSCYRALLPSSTDENVSNELIEVRTF